MSPAGIGVLLFTESARVALHLQNVYSCRKKTNSSALFKWDKINVIFFFGNRTVEKSGNQKSALSLYS